MKRTIQAMFMGVLCCICLYACKKENDPVVTITILSFTPQNGAPGTQVTITGTNFSAVQNENTVKFNGTSAQVNSATSTELTVTVPASATTGKITVQSNGGTATSANDFQVTALANLWAQKKNLEGPGRLKGVAFSIGNKGYFGTGITNNTAPKDFWEYDPVTNSWTQKADFGGTGRWKAAGFSIGNKGYIGLGNDGALSFKKDFWEYDPVANTWAPKADFKGVAREQASGFSIGDKGYIGLGNDGSYKKDFWEYNPANNSWTKKANFDGPLLTIASGFSIGNKGYIAGGFDGFVYQKDFWEYDPGNNSWTKKANFPANPRADAVAFSIGNKGYFGTGFGTEGPSNSYKKDFWEYDPTSDTWTQKKAFEGVARYGAIGFSINNRGYIGFGFDGTNYLNDFWEYEQ